MFRIEALHNSVVDKLVSQGVAEFVLIHPLDDISVKLPRSLYTIPTCMPELYAKRAQEFANFEVRSDDVWIVTYPKCGTTWTQEMVWMIMNRMNFNEAKSVDITTRSIFFELNGMATVESWDSLKALKGQQSPRVIKTHLPIGLLPRDIWRKKCKIVYVTRDPKDVVISFFRHFSGLTPFTGSIEDLSEAFVTDQFIYCSFWNHVLQFWLIREKENVLFLSFEDMKKDLSAIIKKTCVFLEKEKEYTEEQIVSLAHHLSFESMKANPRCNNQGLVKCLYGVIGKEYKDDSAFQFMGRGQVGGYKKELPTKYIEKINQKTKEVFPTYGLDLYCRENQ